MRGLAMAVALCLTAGSAWAQDAMVVKVRGLQLDTATGAATALERATEASRRFCLGEKGFAAEAMDVTTLVCRRDMVARFVRKLNATKVASLHGWDSAGARLAEARTPMTLELTPIGWSGAEEPRVGPGG